MIPELSRDPFDETFQTKRAINLTINYLKRKPGFPSGLILDIGRVSPLTLAIRNTFDVIVDNIDGDLDIISMNDPLEYDWIIYSHTIEHQFNPLHTLLELKPVMNEHSRMIIILPNKPKFLWWNGHYHEIDRYRMGLLLSRAGYRIVSYEQHRLYRKWRFYLKGIRPFLRLFFEKIDYYEIMI